VGQVGVGVQAGEVAHDGRSGGVGLERGEDLVEIGGGVLEGDRHGDQRRHHVGEVDIEGGAQGKAALEDFIGGADCAAKIEAAKVGFGIDLQRDRDEFAAHRAAADIGFRRLAVLLDEVPAQRFGFGIGLLERPAAAGVGGLDHGIVAV
jgi:hypothetical protein